MASLRRHLLEATQNMSSLDENMTDDTSTKESNFDGNMVIILASLLCALVTTLVLNSIARCFLRFRRSRLMLETPREAAARVAVTGLKKRALNQIPTAIIGTSGVEIQGTECPICLADFVNGEKVRVLPKCNHGFHVKCIDTWLKSHSSCPNCRHCLLERPTLPEEAAGDRSPPGNRSDQQDNVVVVITR